MAASVEGVLYDGQPSLAATDAYQQLRHVQSGSNDVTMLVDLAAIRNAFEAALPGMSYTAQQQYQQDVQPWLAPLRTLALSGGTSRDGASSSVEAFLRVGS